MKIAEEVGDADMKEQAKVNFGMANASMKLANHQNDILKNIQDVSGIEKEDDDEGETGEDLEAVEVISPAGRH